MGIIMAVLIAGGITPHETKLSLFDAKTVVDHPVVQRGDGARHRARRLAHRASTMGMKLTKLQAGRRLLRRDRRRDHAVHWRPRCGIPVSTTHTITGAIVGVGSATTKVSAVRWGVASRIVWAWIFTIPAAAAVAAGCYDASAYFAHL